MTYLVNKKTKIHVAEITVSLCPFAWEFAYDACTFGLRAWRTSPKLCPCTVPILSDTWERYSFGGLHHFLHISYRIFSCFVIIVRKIWIVKSFFEFLSFSKFFLICAVMERKTHPVFLKSSHKNLRSPFFSCIMNALTCFFLKFYKIPLRDILLVTLRYTVS